MVMDAEKRGPVGVERKGELVSPIEGGLELEAWWGVKLNAMKGYVN